MSLPLCRRPQWRALAVVVAAVVVVGGAGCGGGADDLTLDPDDTSAVSAESATTPSTTESTTTTTEPTTSTTSVEDAVRAAHTAVMVDMYTIDERVDGWEELPRRARELTTGPYLNRIEDNTSLRESAGEYLVAPGLDSNIMSVRVDGDRASVRDCSKDVVEQYDSEGNLLIPADDFFEIRETSLVLVDGRWLVEEFYAGIDELCDPEDYR